jgi:transposase
VGKTSKSPKAVLLTAHRVGRERLRTYSHLFSPKKFTQPQLFACLVLKEFLRLDYRKLSALLADCPKLAAAIDLEKVPHFTTFQKAHDRLLGSRRAQRLLDETVAGAVRHKLMKRKVKLAAIDGTGFESRHVSHYYAKRKEKTAGNKGRKRRRFPKAGIVCDCQSHVILAIAPGRGPMPDDKHFKPALKQAASQAAIGTLLADAGYDGEPSHRHAREEHGMKTVIPPKRGRPTDKLPKAKWRKRMATHFDKKKYGQRWQVETVNSMIKRLLGSALRSRKTRTQNQEIRLRAITHNVMILWRRVFYRAEIFRFFMDFNKELTSASTMTKADFC